MKVVITSNPYRDKDMRYAKEARDILLSYNIDAPICLAFESDANVPVPEQIKTRDLSAELKNADALICFGGDGTLLHASKAATRRNVPVLGINIGTLGFMAELEASELDKLRLLAEKKYVIEERMMLDVRVLREGAEVLKEHALNDCVITKGAIARVIYLDISCDSIPVMGFSGDGTIVCTPTGSTAYSMSAGGPIVEPIAENIIITPVCAHTMQTRPIVLSGSRKVAVTIGKIGKRNAFLSDDGGKAFRLNTGDVVEVSKSAYKTKLIKITDKSFFSILNTKL